MKGLRLTDLYTSVQGEGPRVGWPTTFIRFGGCNLRCPGWPCDTQYAIEPSQWKNDPVLTPREILERMELLHTTKNVCITGGEPFQQPNEYLVQLVEQLQLHGHTIDVFTNGTIGPFPDWTRAQEVVVVMDWKLRGSGEGYRHGDIKLDNLYRLRQKDWVKFVITSDADLEEAQLLWQQHHAKTWPRWCVGVAWGKYEEKDLVQQLLERELPWILNVQIHKFIFSPEGRQI